MNIAAYVPVYGRVRLNTRVDGVSKYESSLSPNFAIAIINAKWAHLLAAFGNHIINN